MDGWLGALKASFHINIVQKRTLCSQQTTDQGGPLTSVTLQQTDSSTLTEEQQRGLGADLDLIWQEVMLVAWPGMSLGPVGNPLWARESHGEGGWRVRQSS